MEPVRRRMPVNLFASYVPALYESRRTLADAWLGSVADTPGSACQFLLNQVPATA